jgi:hypothetical protein
MTLHPYVTRVLSHAGLRYDRTIKSAIPRRCLVLRDASCDFRDVANRFAKVEVTWYTIYKVITELWLPYLLCARPNEDDTDWPLVVSLDSRPHYVKERDHVQGKRDKVRERYDSLDEALTREKIDLNKFLSTSGGHGKLMELYIQNTTLPLLVLNERHKPVYVVNTRQVPSFLRHVCLVVPPFEPATEFGSHINCVRSLVQWPGKGSKEENKFGYISENDMFLVFVAKLAKQVEPDLEVCVVGRDGDYILTLLLADLPVRHVWPSRAGKVVWFDIPGLLEYVPWGIRPSLVAWLYLTGSDFSEKLMFAPPEAMISASLAVLLRTHQIMMDTDNKYIAALQGLLDNMCFIDPVSWKLDVNKLLCALQSALKLPFVYYEKKSGDEDGDDAGTNDDDNTACGDVAGDGIVACPVAALHPEFLVVTRAMLEYKGTFRALSKGSVRKSIKRNKKQLEASPDLEQFTRASCESICFVLVSAYKAAGHYAQQCISDFEDVKLSERDVLPLFDFA